jgi:ferrous iron transport protein B
MKYNKIALVGNPNTGKTSLFNALTGLNQHVGNFPGVTVDKKSGNLKIDTHTLELIDLPGTYSVYPRSMDEKVVYDIFSSNTHPDYPDAVCVVVDASNLERNLLLFTQIYELGLPTMLVLNMSDVAFRKGKKLKLELFQQAYPEAAIVQTNARLGMGLDRFRKALSLGLPERIKTNITLIDVEALEDQTQDTEKRFQEIQALLSDVQTIENKSINQKKVNRLDALFVHPIWGYGLFLLMLMALFQLIFSLASYPMDLIDLAFGNLSAWVQSTLSQGVLTDLIANGIIPGIGGVVIFVPQIVLLFLFLGILEETGYMSRVVFIMDRLMRPFGLNGKSVVPLLSSAACAIPGVMASRTISNWKERLITILVAPLMSCSARIPVFTLLISLVIPKKIIFGFINLQGLTFFGLYALGIVSALLISIVLKWTIKSKETSMLMLELPDLRLPRWKNVIITVFDKAKIFLLDAGKVIIAISIILWALGTYGPSEKTNNSIKSISLPKIKTEQALAEYDKQVAAVKFENSYIGILGKSIEPVIRPLGYDWKIGISLITSFAAREVFVGSMATIYSVEADDEETKSLLSKMKEAKNDQGAPIYTLASGLSLMVFYVYAMQCMATFAVVKRETKSWKWPIIQLIYMGILAYVASWIVYQIFK